MNKRERALSLVDIPTEKEPEMFLYLFEDKHNIYTVYPNEDEDNDEEPGRLSEAFRQLGEDCFPNDREPQYQPEIEFF